MREGITPEALRFVATLRSRNQVSKVLSEENAMDRLMKEVSTSVPKTIEISNWLLEVINAVNKLQKEMREPVTKSGKDPHEKACAYQRTGLLIAGDVAKMIQEHGWGEEQIKTRENEILDWVSAEYDC